MQNKKKQVTIYEIAHSLGVAVSTVSRALHNDKRISYETIAKVKNAAAQMGYLPNSAARSLRTGKSNTIGLIVRDINDEWCASMMPAIEKNCAKQGMGLLLCNVENTPEKEEFYLQILRQRRVEGIIILTPVYPTQDPYIKYSKLIPLVLIDLFTENPQISAVSVDHQMGAYMSARHLIELGHREISFLLGPLNLSSTNAYIAGYKKAIEESGLVWKKDHIFSGQQTHAEDGEIAFNYFWELKPKPTAIASGSDLMAIGAMRAAQKNGVKIPRDLSIIGYDDIPLSSLVNPPLTTVMQDREALGEKAMQLLFTEMNSDTQNHQMLIIPPKIILRESTSQHKK
jgi:DNA-binding LacI/PurR family transcriptional regulator